MRPIHYAAIALAAVLLLCALWALLGPEPAAATLAAGGAIAASRVRRQRLAEAIAEPPEVTPDLGEALKTRPAELKAAEASTPQDERIAAERAAGRDVRRVRRDS